MLSNLLIYRLLIINLIGFLGLGYAAWRGWVAYVINGDASHLVFVMAAMFAIFLISLANRARKVSVILNQIKTEKSAPDVNGTKFLEKNAHLDDFPMWITLMGLLGNVIGVAIALNAIHPADLADPASTQQAMSRLMDGMHVAFTTTIAGCVLAFWADVNRRVLRTATVLMVEDAKGPVVVADLASGLITDERNARLAADTALESRVSSTELEVANIRTEGRGMPRGRAAL